MPAVSLVYLLAFYAQPIFGLSVTSPAAGDLWNPSSSLKVQWSVVSTDPSNFDVKISNQDANTFPTGFSQDVKKGVSTWDGSFTISGITGLKDGPGYTVNLISGSNGAILAQSQPFNVSTSGTSQGSSAATSSDSSAQGSSASKSSDSSAQGSSSAKSSDSSAQGSSNAVTSNPTTLGSGSSNTASNASQNMNATGMASSSQNSTGSSSKPTSNGNMLHPARMMSLVLATFITMLF